MYLTLTLASVRLVHMAISSRVLISGYRFLVNVASNSCNCCEVKWVLCRRWRLFVLLLLLLALLFLWSFDDRAVIEVVVTPIVEPGGPLPLSFPSSESAPPKDLVTPAPPPGPLFSDLIAVPLPIESTIRKIHK